MENAVSWEVIGRGDFSLWKWRVERPFKHSRVKCNYRQKRALKLLIHEHTYVYLYLYLIPPSYCLAGKEKWCVF